MKLTIPDEFVDGMSVRNVFEVLLCSFAQMELEANLGRQATDAEKERIREDVPKFFHVIFCSQTEEK